MVRRRPLRSTSPKRGCPSHPVRSSSNAWYCCGPCRSPTRRCEAPSRSLTCVDLEPEPPRERLHLVIDRAPERGPERLVLVDRVHDEHPRRPVCGGVELSDETIAVQDRQRVVAPLPLR